MVTDPEKWVNTVAEIGGSQLTFHYEANISNMESLLNAIHSKKMKAGIAIKPNTELSEPLFQLIDKKLVDLILIMTVEPGFGGQKFMVDMMPKVSLLRKKYPYLNIEVDGGINIESCEIAAKNGANVIVSGTGIFGHKSMAEAISKMRDQVMTYTTK
jgi:ribulose-phosphate 3-epimerase